MAVRCVGRGRDCFNARFRVLRLSLIREEGSRFAFAMNASRVNWARNFFFSFREMLQDVEIRDLSKWGRGKVCVKRVVNVVHNGVYDLTL